MNTHAVIESYVADVVRRLPRGTRAEIAAELRGLLQDMLDERAQARGTVADDALVLATLREFGAPADVADRYREPGLLVLPPARTRGFALLSLAGIALQWALTLPRVFNGSVDPGAWWFGSGLGAFWWPGVLIMGYLLGAWLRERGMTAPRWKPYDLDPDRIHRGAMTLGLVAFAVGAAIAGSMPWWAPRLPGPLPAVFAFDPVFLHQRAWLALPLWAASFAILVALRRNGRWSPTLRKLDTASSVSFLLMLAWWVAAPMFQARFTDLGARATIGLVMLFIAIDVVVGVHRQRQVPILRQVNAQP
jgi:hypothetical protein